MTPREDDICKMLKCNTHLGTKNCDVLMEPYVYKRRYDGTYKHSTQTINPTRDYCLFLFKPILIENTKKKDRENISISPLTLS